MKRIVLFLVLAVGGIAALAALGGGLGGTATKGPVPVVAEIAPAMAGAGGAEPMPMEIPGGAMLGGGMPIGVDPAKRFTNTVDESWTWTDASTGESILIRNAPKAAVECNDPAPIRDTTGAQGLRWTGVHIVLYRDKKRWTRADAVALAANPKIGRAGLEQFDITADEGYETTAPLPPGPDGRSAGTRTIIHITKNVVIYDYDNKLFVRTSDAVVDYEAQTAEGAAPVEVESTSYIVRGKGFRVDCKAQLQRLEILENTEFESLAPLDGVARKASDTSAGSLAMAPRRIHAKGSTVLTKHTEGKDTLTDVRMEGGVRVEMDGGQRLDADSIALQLVKRAAIGAASPKIPNVRAAPKLATAVPGANFVPDGMVPERMTANGDVRFEGKDSKGAPMTASGPKLAIDFRGKAVSALRLSGRSFVTWRGEMRLPGQRPSDRLVRASATESIHFGPDFENPGTDGSLLDLIGTARVECGRMPTDATPQRIAADRIAMHLRRRTLIPEVVPATTAPGHVRKSPESDWVATSFSATGGVVLEGPRLSGAAREMKGFDLDRPTYHVTAIGPDAHLEIADDPEPAAAARGNEKSDAAKTKPDATSAPRATWLLDRLLAREHAMGSFRVRANEGAVTFAGDELTYRRASGAEIRAKSGEDAHLALDGEGGRDHSIDAPTIYLRNGTDERVLETVGRTRAAFWVGGDGPGVVGAVASGPGHRVIELRSTSRIEITGSNAGKGADATFTVALADGGSLSARTDGAVTDRLTATTIELSLIETIPGPGESGFAMLGKRRSEPGAEARVGKTAKAPVKEAQAPGRYVLRSDTLSLAVGVEGKPGSAGSLRRIKADGHVEIDGDEPSKSEGTASKNAFADATEGPRHFEGTRFTYDAATFTGVLLGTASRSASITLGRAPIIDRILSPKIDVMFRDGRLSRAVFAAPVRGVFRTKSSSMSANLAQSTLEEFILESMGGALTVEGNTAVVAGSAEQPVYVQRTVRSATGQPNGSPVTITTPRLRLTTSAPFGAPGSTLAALDADGPGSRIEAGLDPLKRESATGDSIRYVPGPPSPKTADGKPIDPKRGDPKNSGPGHSGSLRITASRGSVIIVKPGQRFEGTDVAYDFADGKIHAKFSKIMMTDSK